MATENPPDHRTRKITGAKMSQIGFEPDMVEDHRGRRATMPWFRRAVTAAVR